MPLTERDARALIAIVNTRNVDKIVEEYAETAVFEIPGREKPMRGKEEIRNYLRENLTAFPDWTLNPKTVAVTGKEVLVVDTAGGTHNGPLMGWDGKPIAPTHKKVLAERMTHIILDDSGKIESFKVYGNPLTIREQLGLPVPRP